MIYMNTVSDHMSKIGIEVVVAWLIIGLIFVTGYKHLMDFIVFVLLKLYEFFIENKNHLSIN
jgi:hypothetical protein